MSETINDKLKKLITKINSIQGQQLTMGKRLTALEEQKGSPEFIGDKELLFRIARYLGSAVGYEVDKPTEGETIDETEEEGITTKEDIEEMLGQDIPEEISQETLDALDEVIE